MWYLDSWGGGGDKTNLPAVDFFHSPCPLFWKHYLFFMNSIEYLFQHVLIKITTTIHLIQICLKLLQYNNKNSIIKSCDEGKNWNRTRMSGTMLKRFINERSLYQDCSKATLSLIGRILNGVGLVAILLHPIWNLRFGRSCSLRGRSLIKIDANKIRVELYSI